MKLIADCGSTKIDWNVIGGSEPLRFETTGMNAVMLTRDQMAKQIADEAAAHLIPGIEEVYFYGAGCVSAEVCQNVVAAINETLPDAKVEVYSDLLAAARALCGHEAGLACIMGTGSNACYYDGDKIVTNVSPLGYILGDEGSGAVLGKLLVGNVLKRQLPKDLCQKFLDETGLDALTVIDRVYRKPAANRFLASLSPFLLRNIDRKEISDMVLAAFEAFVVRNVLALVNLSGLTTVNFVGSIAYYYREWLERALAMHGLEIGRVLKSPMEGLVEYHLAE